MKNFILAFLASMTLSGCVYQDISYKDIDIGHQWCSDKGGVFQMRSFFSGRIDITCRNVIIKPIGSDRYSSTVEDASMDIALKVGSK